MRVGAVIVSFARKSMHVGRCMLLSSNMDEEPAKDLLGWLGFGCLTRKGHVN